MEPTVATGTVVNVGTDFVIVRFDEDSVEEGGTEELRLSTATASDESLRNLTAGQRVEVAYVRTPEGFLAVDEIAVLGVAATTTTTTQSNLVGDGIDQESELEQDVEETVADIDEEVDSAFDSIDEEADETAADINAGLDEVGDELDDVDEEIAADTDDDMDSLPATGSRLPLLALLGAFALAGAAVLRFLV
jgi:hypothetical protein